MTATSHGDNDKTKSHIVLTKDTMVSHYRVIEKIGAGGMGEVYLAEDTQLDRKVALKFLPPHLCQDEDCRARFKREAQAAAKLNHPNIITVYEVSEHQGRPFFSMEHVEGQSLRDQAKAKGLDIARIIDLTMQICDGLRAAHEKGVVHRDIKPSNIVIDAYGRPRILDFGLAGVQGGEHLTRTGSTLGTVRYMSPEQVMGKALDQRSDLFSLGVVLYELVTGHSPFARDNDAATGQATITHVPEPLARYCSGLPDGLQAIIDKALEKDVEVRYQTAAGMLADLKRVRKGLEPKALPIGAMEPSIPTPRKKLSRLIFSTSALAAIVLLVLILKPWRFEVSSRQEAVASENALAILYFENLQDPQDEERLGQILQDLIITDLSELSSIRVLSRQRLFDVQRQLGYGDRGKIDPETGTEVARKAGANTMLSGNLMRLGDNWILTCQLIDVEDGTVIKSQRIDGSDLYAMVDDLSGRVREDLSLPVNLEDGVDLSVREKTTTSMEAYRHYLAGLDLLDETRFKQATEEFGKAIAADSSFVRAYYKRAIAQGWQFDTPNEDVSGPLVRILEEQLYTSERERMQITGMLAIIDSRYTDALAVYQRLVEEFPDDKEAWYGLGEAYYHESTLRYDQALEAFKKAIELDLTFVIAYRHIFHINVYRRNYNTAIETAHTLINLKPENPMGYRYLVQAHISKGDTTETQLAVEQALRHHTTQEDLKGLYYEMAWAYYDISDNENTETYARKALEYDPDSSDLSVVSMLGSALLGQKEYDEAGRVFERGLELNANSAWCLDGLRYIASKEEEYDRAIDYGLRLAAISPQRPSRYSTLLDLYFKTSRFDAADSILEAGMAAIPSVTGQVELLYRAARIYEQNYWRKRAEQLYRRGEAIDTAGENALIYWRLAQIANNKRRHEEAEELALKALDIEPTNAGAVRELVSSYIYQGKYDEAAQIGHGLVEAKPHLGWSYLYLIRALIAGHRFEQADSVLEVAIEKDAKANVKAGLLWEAGFSYWKVDSLDKCERFCRRALTIVPDHKGILRDLGRWYSTRGKYDQARACLDTLLSIDSTHFAGHVMMARWYLLQEKYDEAELWLRKTIELDSTRTIGSWGMVVAHCARGRFEDALTYAEHGLSKDSSFSSYLMMAWVLVFGDIDIHRGMEFARMAIDDRPLEDEWIRENPYTVLPQHCLGLGYLKLGEYREALKWLEEAQHLRPDDERVTRDLQLLKDRMKG